MKNRKGIILAGGTGTRLHPVTLAVSKQLLPLYNKPMIYYPLSTLMLGEMRDILVITTPLDQPMFRRLLGEGEDFGIRLTYAVQKEPRGIAQALSIAEDYLDGAPSCLILGDNLFYGQGLGPRLRQANHQSEGATIFVTHVNDPEHYGVVEVDALGAPTSLQEKPRHPQSNLAITGLYFYDAQAPKLTQKLNPSPRGELEITDLNRLYLDQNQLNIEYLGRGHCWMDIGTHDRLAEAGQFVRTIESRQGLHIGCPEEIAWSHGWLDQARMKSAIAAHGGTTYGNYLKELVTKK